MHLGHESLKSIFLFWYLAPFWGFAQIPVCRSFESLSQKHSLLLSWCFSSIPFFTVPSAPTTTGITMVFICHIFCMSTKSLYLLFFSISLNAMFLTDGTVISISLQVVFTESLTMMSGLFTVIVLSVLTGMSHMMVRLLSLLFITVSGVCWYHLSVILRSWSLQILQWRYAAALLCLCFG